MTELKGTVILDEKTINDITEEIRNDVLEDIKKDGLYFHEVIKYLDGCTHDTYFNIIKQTIDKIIEKTDTKDIQFSADIKKFDILKLIHGIMNI